jgi:hypothetical protein
MVFVMEDAKPAPAAHTIHTRSASALTRSSCLSARYVDPTQARAAVGCFCACVCGGGALADALFFAGSQSSCPPRPDAAPPGRSASFFAACFTGIETGNVWKRGVSPLISGTTDRVRSASIMDCVGLVTTRPALRDSPPPTATAGAPWPPALGAAAGCNWPSGPKMTAARKAC